MSSPTDRAACFVIQRILEEKWDISIVQLRGWGSLGSGPGSSSLCALRMVFGPLSEGRPASRPPCSEIQVYQTWVPQKSANLCVPNGAPHLSSKLPESPIPATASLQLGHQPPAPSRSHEAPGSVLLPSFWSSGCRSCHALTSSVYRPRASSTWTTVVFCSLVFRPRASPHPHLDTAAGEVYFIVK